MGLLAGANDIDLVERTKQGRDINRHAYSIEEAAGELDRSVVRRLLRLMEFRNTHPSFGTNEIEVEVEKDGKILRISRVHENQEAVLSVDLHRKKAEIHTTGPDGSEKFEI